VTQRFDQCDGPHPNPSPEGEGLARRAQKWTLRDQAKQTNSPPLQGRGRGWGLSANRMAEIAGYAREMRRNPTEPEIRLWRHLSRSQLEGHKFRRQAEIGPFIVDFLCPQKAFVVEVDGETHDIDTDRGRDRALGRLGFRVLHVTNPEVMRNMEGVLAAILGALQAAPDRWERPHPNPSPEGEGLLSGGSEEYVT
jgi:very-short-patch-repair endonuclease